jgi:Tfp pilus assembly protein PilE
MLVFLEFLPMLSCSSVRRFHHGLTLLELVVVLTILVALGGIVVNMVPNMLGRSHYAACATNIPELGKSIEEFQALRGSYPDRYDSLRDSSGTLVTYLPSMMTNTFATNGLVSSPTLTASDVAALSAAGIKTVVPMIEKPSPLGDWSASIWPYSSSRNTAPTAVPVTTSNLNQLNNTLAATVLGQDADPDCRYVIFGIGSQCTLVGVTSHEAPTAFVANMSQSINDMYYRYGAVYKVADSTGTSLTRAKFVGVVMLSAMGIKNAEQHVSAWYNANSDESR